jgi:hypothetical protein
MNIIKSVFKNSKVERQLFTLSIRVKLIVLSFFLLGSSTIVEAQLLLQDYHTYKVSDGKLKVRWEPKNSIDWSTSKTIGYTVEIYNVTGGGNRLISSELIKPSSVDDWLKHESKTSDDLHEFAVGARELIYPDSDKNKFDEIFDLDGDKARGDRLSLGFLMYSASYDFEVAKLSGLGYELTYDPSVDYRFKIYSAKSEAIEFDIISKNISDPELPAITETWDNMKVDVKWDGAGFQKDYFGYMVSRSEDGILYKTVNGKPITNTLGLVADSSDLLEVTYTDSLTGNNKIYWYKVQGFDYFGELSKSEYVFTGQGFVPIGISPIIEYATQTEDNHAEIRWYMPEEFDELIRSYRIMRAEHEDGKYEIAKDSISSETKEVKIPLEYTQNHFRVEAVPYNGRPVGSISVFIMGQDTIPPAMPIVIGAFIDSVGQIVIEWEANTESDLWGYRLFKSNFDNQEFGLITKDLLRDTMYRDTVDLKFGTEEVLYKLQASDKRDNRSPFTDIIRVQKPDIIPPGSPVISSITQSNDTVVVNWTPSSSNDVVNYHLYRRAVNLENSWTLVSIIDTTTARENFHFDVDLDYEVPYSYTLIAFDEVGLKSEPTSPKQITMHKKVEKFDPIVAFDFELDEDKKNVKISWDLKDKSRLKQVLVYRGASKDKMRKYKFVKGSETSLFDSISREAVYYMIKPIYEDQKESHFSDSIEIILSGE